LQSVLCAPSSLFKTIYVHHGEKKYVSLYNKLN
jgi:hypothetical protein